MVDLTLDFHAHVLPTLDHGSDSVDTTLFQLSEAKRHGVEHICATSHFYPSGHNVADFLERREASFNLLSARLDESHPRLHLGAEVLLCDGIESMPGLSELFISGTNTLLLELPFADFSYTYVNSVYSLVRSGVDVVLAHAERYNEYNIEQMIQNGAKLQINASSIAGILMPSRIKRWLDRGLVVAVGSDIHGRDACAYRRFSRGVRRIKKYISPIIEYAKNIIE